jgi:hypothetical protein
MEDRPELKAAAALLEGSEDYRILRRLAPCKPTGTLPPDERIKTGLFLDVETTGLDPVRLNPFRQRSPALPALPTRWSRARRSTRSKSKTLSSRR